MKRQAKAAVLQEPGRFELGSFDVPSIGSDDALLRVEACGVCGSDYEVYDGQLKGWINPITFPVILGHEPLGVIEEIGATAQARWGVKKGDRVAVRSRYTCGRCERCQNGHPAKCIDAGVYGMTGIGQPPSLWGGMAEYLYLAPGSDVEKMDPSLPAEIAVMFNPMGAGFAWAVERPNLVPGQSIAILGAGQRGLASVIAAREAGASFIAVTGLGRDAHKLARAHDLSADLTINVEADDPVAMIRDATNGRGVDVVLDTVPYATSAIDQAVEIAAYDGTIVLAGVKAKSMTFDSDRLISKSLRMMGVDGTTRTAFVKAIRLIESGKYDLAPLHTHSFGLKDAERALLVLSGQIEDQAIHVAVIPGMNALGQAGGWSCSTAASSCRPEMPSFS